MWGGVELDSTQHTYPSPFQEEDVAWVLNDYKKPLENPELLDQDKILVSLLILWQAEVYWGEGVRRQPERWVSMRSVDRSPYLIPSDRPARVWKWLEKLKPKAGALFLLTSRQFSF